MGGIYHPSTLTFITQGNILKKEKNEIGTKGLKYCFL